jgi:hypothetical protein
MGKDQFAKGGILFTDKFLEKDRFGSLKSPEILKEEREP